MVFTTTRPSTTATSPPAYDPETGEDRWLDTTIYLQIYPNAATEKVDPVPEEVDPVPEEFDSQQGHHLQKTVFEISSSVVAYPKEQNWYNHSIALNRDLITDKIARQSEHPEFTPRNRNLFTDDAATMLIIEAAEGDLNSISHTDRAQLMPALKRNDGNYFTLVSWTVTSSDASCREIPATTTDDEGAWFWTGAAPQK